MCNKGLKHRTVIRLTLKIVEKTKITVVSKIHIFNLKVCGCHQTFVPPLKICHAAQNTFEVTKILVSCQ